VNQSANRPESQGATFMSHLLELRDRLMRGGGAVLVLFIAAAPFANTLYEYLAMPLMAALPEGNSMISTEPHGPFFVPFKFASQAAFFFISAFCSLTLLSFR
jgi:sec-independent protein translocase protein TatC